MDNFTFFNPTRIEFGTDQEQRIGQHLAKHGIQKVLLTFGSDRIKRDGLFAQVSASLAAHGIAFVECGGIVSNPVISKVREGIDPIEQAVANRSKLMAMQASALTFEKCAEQYRSTPFCP